MIPELGHFALALACILALAQGLLPIWGAQTAHPRLMGVAPALAYGQFIAVASAFGCLMWSFAINDTTVSNVVANSHSAKPMLYRLSGSWGNHEGSMVLWVLILALCGAAVAGFGRSGIPLYVLYSSDLRTPPVILPEVLTPSILLGALDRLPTATTVAR